MFQTAQGVIKPIVYIGIINGDRLLMVDYKVAPNPAKTGWWIPAPGLEFGEDPGEKAAQVAKELGLETESPTLRSVESFVLPGGWHLIYHYILKTAATEVNHENVRESKWVTSAELSEMTNVAHGKWEVGVGLQYLKA
jgi:ADP-ribose pyrophosphatase YjhB (NUDIX family)